MKTTTAMVTAALALAIVTAPALAQGADRAQVERAQQALRAAGHDPGAIDGVMGARTSAALKAYQQQQGLDATGRLDDATLAKLGGAAHPDASPSTTQAGGDKAPSPVDPAQATTTGANAGEGASYSRSNEKK